MAPRDLEKYGAPTAHASYFFFKKNLFTSTTTIKNSKTEKYFSTCLLFYFLLLLHNKAINTLFYVECLLFSITFIRKVSTKIY